MSTPVGEARIRAAAKATSSGRKVLVTDQKRRVKEALEAMAASKDALVEAVLNDGLGENPPLSVKWGVTLYRDAKKKLDEEQETLDSL